MTILKNLAKLSLVRSVFKYMIFINTHEAKTQLSKYLVMVAEDDETVVVCKNGKPIAQLTGYKPIQPISFGLLEGQIKMSDTFDDPLPKEFLEYFK